MTKKEINRNKILDAAKLLFVEKGYKESSMNDVAIQAELGRRTVYRYFDNKDLLLIAIITDYFEAFGHVLTHIVYELKMTSFERIEFLLEQYSEFFHDNLSMLHLIGMMDINIDQKSRLTDIYTNFVEKTKIPDVIIASLIESGKVDNSVNKEIDSELTALTINNSLLSLASRVISHKVSLDNEQGIESWKMVDELANILLQGIKSS